jgi:hypothetical protein
MGTYRKDWDRGDMRMGMRRIRWGLGVAAQGRQKWVGRRGIYVGRIGFGLVKRASCDLLGGEPPRRAGQQADKACKILYRGGCFAEVQTCMQVQIHVDASKGRQHQTKLMIRDAETRRSTHAGGSNV